MASEAPTNGESSTLDVPMSAAERLMKQHAADESHRTTVEEVPDEDAPHPAPSAAPSLPITAEPSRAHTPANDATMSSKAAGKQPMPEEPRAPSKPALDTQSEELFPALGPAKAAPATAAPTPWSRKPAAVGKAANGTSNGLVNGSKPSPNMSLRTSTPASGMMTPSSTAPSQRSQTGQMALPGRSTESIQLHPNMLRRRGELKKPMAEILRDINKRSKATVTHREGPGGVITFEGTGPVDAVRIALKEVANQLCANQNIQVPVPASVRGKIVGKGGATVQAISKKTGAKINISKQEAAAILEDDDLDHMVDVTIGGDPFAVEMAKQDIEKIVDEHTSSLSTRLKHIPAEYYPFLAAESNARMQQLQQGHELKMQIPPYYTYNNQAPQVPMQGQPATFAPQAGLPIHLSGEREAVAAVRIEIDRQVAELQRQLTLQQIAIERGRHQFTVGNYGTSLQDFMRETGCSVILPPEGSDSEDVIVVGPEDRLEGAMDKLMDLATSMQNATADIAKQHPNAPQGAQAHARDVTRYLQQRQALAELEKLHGARIVPDSSGNWQIYARDGRSAMKARQDIMNLISGHPPTRFSPLEVNPFYHEHLRKQAARQVRENHGVRVVIPEDEDSPVLLVYEDRAPSPGYELPRRAPTAQDAQTYQQALQEAQQYIMNLISGQQGIVSREMNAPVKFHDKIRRHVDRHHQGLPEDHIPTQVMYGGPRQPQAASRHAPTPSVSLRGPQDNVDALMQSLFALIEQEKQDELERGFTLSCDFPQKFASHIIGKGGENINRLREEFDVDIQLQDGRCEIKGPEAKANACKKHILDMARKLEDEVEHHLNIPQQFHRELIGPQGSQVHRLQDRYNVRVQFPRNKQIEDDASEAGDAAPSRRSNQLPHEVIIKGPSRGADACRDELLSLLQYVKDNSFTASVSVAQNQLPSLIGSGGREMEAMRLETGAQIDVMSTRDAASTTGRAEIKIKGPKGAVEAAKKLIEERAKVFDKTVTRNLDVDTKHHRFIIGQQGSTLISLIEQAGGPTDARGRARTVRFPRTEAEGKAIRIEGQKSVVDKLCAAIEALVKEQESQTNDVVEVKPEKHRLLIGRGGETRRQLEQQFGVHIIIPRHGETGPQRSQVKIAGQPDKVESAKAHILEITKDQEGETVQVPRKFHHAIVDNGQFFRRLRNDHAVTVDHAGQRPPPRPSVPAPSRTKDSSTPLITDGPAANANNHSWNTYDLFAGEDGEIPWVLSGPSPSAVASARAKLDRALEEAGKQDTVGFLILPDPRAYRHVIGPGGSEINRIRKQTGTKIHVPRDQGKDEAIEITGSKSGVEEAKEAIIEIVQNNA